MRIIGGKLRSRKINIPQNIEIRPTTDFAKESLFNILNNLISFEETKFLDLFCGSGSISYEFFSRGGNNITCVDNNFKSIEFIKKTIEIFKADAIKPIKIDALKYIESCNVKFDTIFADPPYDMGNIDKIPDLIFNNNLLNDEGIFILEHSNKYNFSENQNLFDNRKYGSVNFSFFRKL